jgi:hypothetical protein
MPSQSNYYTIYYKYKKGSSAWTGWLSPGPGVVTVREFFGGATETDNITVDAYIQNNQTGCISNHYILTGPPW